MKKTKSKSIPLEKDLQKASLAIDRLGAFFDLLLKIDKRQHPEIYVNQTSRDHSH
jgi:hypothetical protein